MSLSPRVAVASGAAGSVAAAFLIAGRVPGSVVAALLLAFGARAAATAAFAGFGPLAAESAGAGLRNLALGAPAITIAAAAAIVRAGSIMLPDVRGAHAVAGPALTHGPVLTVAGMWLCFLAATAVVAIPLQRGARDATPEGAAPVVAPALVWVEYAAASVTALLVAAMFAGPQVTGALDMVPWLLAAAFVVAAAWRLAPFWAHREAPLGATVAAVAGLVLVLVGGAA